MTIKAPNTSNPSTLSSQAFVNAFLDRKDGLSNEQVFNRLKEIGNADIQALAKKLYKSNNTENLRALYLNVYLTSVTEEGTSATTIPVYDEPNNLSPDAQVKITRQQRETAQASFGQTTETATHKSKPDEFKAQRPPSPTSVTQTLEESATSNDLNAKKITKKIIDQKTHQTTIKSFLTTIARGWDSTSSQQETSASETPERSGTSNPGSFASTANEDHLPLNASTDQVNEKLKPHGLQKLTNSGKDGLCLVYSVVMGATGLNNQDAHPIVEKIKNSLDLANQENSNSNWFALDNEMFVGQVLPAIENNLKLDKKIHLVAIQNSAEEYGFTLTGRSSNDFDPNNEMVVLVHQGRNHYDAVWPAN